MKNSTTYRVAISIDFVFFIAFGLFFLTGIEQFITWPSVLLLLLQLIGAIGIIMGLFFTNIVMEDNLSNSSTRAEFLEKSGLVTNLKNISLSCTTLILYAGLYYCGTLIGSNLLIAVAAIGVVLFVLARVALIPKSNWVKEHEDWLHRRFGETS